MSIKSTAFYNKTPCIINIDFSNDLNNKIYRKTIMQIIGKLTPLAITTCNTKNISIYCANLQQAKEVIHQVQNAANNGYFKITPINNMSKTLL